MSKLLTPFKYAGSKVKELKILSKWIPKGSRIVEPFGGTGVVTKFFGDCSGNEWNDTNEDLVNLLLFIKFSGKVPYLRDMCRELMKEENQNHYFFYQKRNEFNQLKPVSYTNEIDYFALFLYLQNTAHFGLYRNNAKGEYTSTFHYFNKPYYSDKRIDYLVDLVNKLDYITQLDYKKFIEYEFNGKFMFLDPPYIGTSNCGNFSINDMKILNEYCTKRSTHSRSLICTYQYSKDDTRYWDLENIMSGAKEIYTKMTTAHQKLSDIKKSLKKQTVYLVY